MIDDVINIITSSGVYFTDPISKNRFWSANYTPDNVTMLMTSSITFIVKPATGISFKLIPLVELKLFNFVISAILVCKIHKKVAEKMTPFLSINY